MTVDINFIFLEEGGVPRQANMEWIKTIENTCGSYMPENVFDKLEGSIYIYN